MSGDADVGPRGCDVDVERLASAEFANEAPVAAIERTHRECLQIRPAPLPEKHLIASSQAASISAKLVSEPMPVVAARLAPTGTQPHASPEKTSLPTESHETADAADSSLDWAKLAHEPITSRGPARR